MCTCRQTGKIPVHGQGRMFDYTFECTTAGGTQIYRQDPPIE